MIFGADSQNKNLKDAASKQPNRFNKTETSSKYAASIASSKNATSGSEEGSQPTVSAAKNPRRSDQIKGSLEGYMHGASTHIQMKGSGYSNPTLQRARYNKVTADQSSSMNPMSFTKSAKSSIIDNNARVGISDSSSERIKEINKRNNLV
jgi:hypothetical protein